MVKSTGTIRIGTSGWSYEHWKGPFYPREIASGEMLAFYSERFDAVEINASFYRLPSETTLVGWRSEVPKNFVFAAKASRYITHMKKLKDPEEPLETFLDRVSTLGPRLGPVVFQLPPRWRVNVDRFLSFTSLLPRGKRFAFEFRDPSWHVESIYETLRRCGAAFCIFDLGGFESPSIVTADFVYVRLHGPDGPYRGSYGTPSLRRWAERALAWAGEGKDVYIFFDNDEAGFAPANALRLKEMVERGA